MNSESSSSFGQLGLSKAILKALTTLGYESPSPIQEKSIPWLLEGRDVIAQAQTGSGKTAAFALPIIERMNMHQHSAPQALVLAPTRELALQVTGDFENFTKFIPGFRVATIYGGKSYDKQFSALKAKPHVVVGTPGRIIDLLRRQKLDMSKISTLVLDEADEMLQRGFLDDIQYILKQVKHQHQTVLFSATMPKSICKVSERFLNQPKRIQIKSSSTAETVKQYAMLVNKVNKFEVLARYFEVENINAALIFTGTKKFSEEAAERLAQKKFKVAALNGDMNQRARERVIEAFRKGRLDIIVATEVAARGLDVERISHVINLDLPQSAESYVHRIGRTGRAGRTGQALSMVTSREMSMLSQIERAISQPLQRIKPPSVKDINNLRLKRFKQDIKQAIDSYDIDEYKSFVKELQKESDFKVYDMAAAMAYLLHKEKSLEECKNIKFDARADHQPQRRRRRRRR